MNLTIFGNDNVLLRSYLFFLTKNSEIKIDLILFPNLSKQNKKILDVSEFKRSSIFEKYNSNLNLKIPFAFWGDPKINSILNEYFLTNYNTDVSGFKEFLKMKLRKIDTITEINFYNSKNINMKTLENINFKTKNNIILNTGSFIYTQKLITNLNDKVYHVHPGYLPDLKGADGIFWSILKFNKVGMSLFRINEKIDEGEIYARKYFDFYQFKHRAFNNLKTKEKYNFILSTLDPILRAKYFTEWGINSLLKKEPIQNSSGNYNTFMNKKELENVMHKIF